MNFQSQRMQIGYMDSGMFLKSNVDNKHFCISAIIMFIFLEHAQRMFSSLQ